MKPERINWTLQDWYRCYRGIDSTFKHETRWDSYIRARLAILFYRRCFEHGFFIS